MTSERPGSPLGSWANTSARRSCTGAFSESTEGDAAVGVTIDNQVSRESSYANVETSTAGSNGRIRRRVHKNSKSSVLGALGLGSSFFRGNVKDELKKQEYLKTVVALKRRDSNYSVYSSNPGGNGSQRSSIRMIDRVIPWRRKNQITNFGEFEDEIHCSDILNASAEDEANKRASTLSLSNQVLEALQSVGPSLRQASIAEAMQDEDKRLSWMNKLVGNAYQLARTTEEEEEEEEERGDVHEHQLEVFFNPLSAFRARWDLIIVIAIFYSCAVLPLRAAFGDNKVGPFFMFDMGLTVLFMIDIFLNFNTGYDDDGIVVMEKVSAVVVMKAIFGANRRITTKKKIPILVYCASILRINLMIVQSA